MFWKVLFGLYCFTLCRYLFSLSCSPAFSGLFPQVGLLFFPVLSVPFSYLFHHYLFIIQACFCSFFLFAFSVEFPILVWTVSPCFLSGSQFPHKLILNLHRLVHLTRLYYSSVCKVVYDLFYLFLSYVFSILCFIAFSLLMILFTYSRFNFCSCDGLSSWLLGSVYLGVLCFHLLKFSVLFRWIVFIWHHIIIFTYSSRVFHISISWWSFTGVSVTASLLKSPGFVSVFWPSSAMLSFG